MYQVLTRKTRSRWRVVCLLHFQKMLGLRKRTNSKFTALKFTKFWEDWEVFDGSLEGMQYFYFTPLLILSSYFSDIQIHYQTLLWMVTIEMYCVSFFVKMQIKVPIFLIQYKKDMFGECFNKTDIAEWLLSSSNCSKYLSVDYYFMECLVYLPFCSKVKVNTKIFFDKLLKRLKSYCLISIKKVF